MSFDLLWYAILLLVLAILVLRVFLKFIKRAIQLMRIDDRCQNGLLSQEEFDEMNRLASSVSKEDQLLFEQKAKQILNQ